MRSTLLLGSHLMVTELLWAIVLLMSVSTAVLLVPSQTVVSRWQKTEAWRCTGTWADVPCTDADVVHIAMFVEHRSGCTLVPCW